MIEVELKFELLPTSWPRLEKQLTTMKSLRFLRNSDIYYDTIEFDLLRQAVFVRVRNHTSLEFKFNEQASPLHNQCTERVFPLVPELHQVREMNALFSRYLPHWRPVDTVAEVMHKNSLVELAQIENRRVQYTYDNLVICVDQVEGLGDFLEVEMMCEEGSDTIEAEASMHCFASRFSARQVRVGYVELWLQKHHPQAYQIGRYHL